MSSADNETPSAAPKASGPEAQGALERARRLVIERQRQGGRTLIGIAGPPAAGKSTLAEALVAALNHQAEGPAPRAALLPMDGYHLDNRLLDARGLRARKGAPDTFDAYGFCAAVRELKAAARETFHPLFDRALDLGIANAIAIAPQTPVVVVEGNYLLLKSQPWAALRTLFDATVFVAPPLETLHERLISRWLGHGLDRAAAEARVAGNDLRNARLVLAESGDADLWLTA